MDQLKKVVPASTLAKIKTVEKMLKMNKNLIEAEEKLKKSWLFVFLFYYESSSEDKWIELLSFNFEVWWNKLKFKEKKLLKIDINVLNEAADVDKKYLFNLNLINKDSMSWDSSFRIESLLLKMNSNYMRNKSRKESFCLEVDFKILKIPK